MFPIALLALFLLICGVDSRWESHVAHFLAPQCSPRALVTLGLGYARQRDLGKRAGSARLFLISLAFMASFGALHALATSDVLLGRTRDSSSQHR